MSKRKIIRQYKKEEKKNNPEPLKILLCVFPFFMGMYFEWSSAVACISILGYLGYCFRNTGRILISRSTVLLAAVVITIAYGLSAFWAVDAGMALFGMLKYLPLPLLVLAVEQLDTYQRHDFMAYIPVSGAIMTVVSGVLGMLPVFEEYFTVNKRLAGFFQYPNTFALYLLTGIIIVLFRIRWQKEKKEILDFLILISLLAGIILTGSRTGFVLLLLAAAGFAFLSKKRKICLALFGLLLMVVAAVGVYVLITGDMASVGRMFTISFSSSTFLGRLLYFKDAIPVILKHPLGLGYMGYYFTQGSFQTGVYSVVNVHNELLQLLLDVGWIPTGIFLWVVILGIRKGNMQSRMIMIVIILHSMMDFNLQFISIGFLLFTAMDTDGSDNKVVKEFTKKSVLVSGTVAILCFSMWLSTASALYYLKMYRESVLVYPGYTNAWMQLLTEAENAEEMDEMAEHILKINPDNPLANNTKARVAYSRGDFGNLITYKEKALEYYRYSLDEYLDYFNMLYVGYQLYLENGDSISAEVCAENIKEIPEMLEEVVKRTDPLAYQINDKPELELPVEYEEILSIIR